MAKVINVYTSWVPSDPLVPGSIVESNGDKYQIMGVKPKRKYTKRKKGAAPSNKSRNVPENKSALA